MSTKRNRRRSQQVSEHVQNVPENTFLPPGSGQSAVESNAAPEATNDDVAVHIGDESPKEGAEYPESKVIDGETHKAQEEAAAEEREQRAKKATGPKRLSSQEMLNMALLIKLLPEGENVPLSTPISLDNIPAELKASFFEVGNTRNMAQRGLVKLLIGPETKQLDTLEITEIGFHLYQKQSGKLGPAKQTRTTRADGKPRVAGGRTSKKYGDNLRIRKIATENPRHFGVQAYYAWNLYSDGMTYKEYMDKKDYTPVECSNGTLFKGPRMDHFNWDLGHGFIALYNAGENELLDDGSPNPKYWAVNNNPK